ncbi:flagellar hook-length control protein FliK [Flavimaricola marinus]|nr:flagellar hook-length control protein FliK [Flavimaricola marinus]
MDSDQDLPDVEGKADAERIGPRIDGTADEPVLTRADTTEVDATSPIPLLFDHSTHEMTKMLRRGEPEGAEVVVRGADQDPIAREPGTLVRASDSMPPHATSLSRSDPKMGDPPREGFDRYQAFDELRGANRESRSGRDFDTLPSVQMSAGSQPKDVSIAGIDHLISGDPSARPSSGVGDLAIPLDDRWDATRIPDGRAMAETTQATGVAALSTGPGGPSGASVKSLSPSEFDEEGRGLRPDRSGLTRPPESDLSSRETVLERSAIDPRTQAHGATAAFAGLVSAKPQTRTLSAFDPVAGLEAEQDGLMVELDFSVHAPGDTRSGPSSIAAATPASVAQSASAQIARAAIQANGARTELILDPEELGKVRLNMVSDDRSITLHVMADRPDTLDLLRRNIETLEQEFRDLGFEDVTFAFGEQAPPQRQVDRPLARSEQSGTDSGEIDTATVERAHQGGPDGHLDIRL